jgi:glycosyltransferase involved in cell wall biosynthesis
MRIAILTSGILPVPAIQGGAVETLVDLYLEFNDQHRLHDITVYSVWHPDVVKHHALQSNINHYIYIKVNNWWAKLKKKLYQKTHSEEYYHYSIEYYLEQALKHIKKQKYDLIILENRPGYALKLKDYTHAKIVYHLHNDFLNSESKYATELYNSAFRIITVSNYIANRVRTITSDDSKCLTVHNGIDTRAFSCKAVPVTLESIKSDDFIIVYSGRVNNEKGIMELISAMNLIGKDYAIKLLVLGSSFYGNADNNNPFAQKLREMSEPIRDRIIFTGFIPYAEMPGYLKLADIAVLPSTWDEPFGLTMAEAQAMGLPIITTRRGGIPEVVTEKNAILLDTDEHFINNLASSILDLYHHPDKRKEMSKASIANSKYFNYLRYVEDFFKGISSVKV